MKKLALFLTASLLLSSVFCFGCSGTEAESSTSSEPESSADESSEVIDELNDETKIQDASQKYYYNKLSGDEKKALVRLYNTALACGKQVDFTVPLPSESLDRVMFFLNYDCPELIHLSGDYYPIYQDDTMENVTGVQLSYNMDSKRYAECNTKLDAYFEDLKKSLEGKSDYEKELNVYNLIFNSCSYNEDRDNSGSVYGVLIEKAGRCEGISKAFMMCMRKLGIERIDVVGVPDWDNDAVYLNHSWNIIKLDGEYYHVDLTVDNFDETSAIRPANYGLFNVTDEVIYQTRTANKFFSDIGLPVCTADKYNYHKINDTLISGGSDIMESFKDILTKRFVSDRTNTIPIKIEFEDDYQAYKDKFWDEFSAYIKEKGYQTKNDSIFYSDVCNTITVYAEPAEETSGAESST